ncbi:MAG: hypothetical protein QOH49_454 [Acidobacteriota bacterium]|nr:hypothetical protein [Acidobacteriota bacterium]
MENILALQLFQESGMLLPCVSIQSCDSAVSCPSATSGGGGGTRPPETQPGTEAAF